MFDENVDLEDIIKTRYGSSFGNFIEGDLKSPGFIKEQTNYFRHALKTKLDLRIFLVII